MAETNLEHDQLAASRNEDAKKQRLIERRKQAFEDRENREQMEGEIRHAVTMLANTLLAQNNERISAMAINACKNIDPAIFNESDLSQLEKLVTALKEMFADQKRTIDLNDYKVVNDQDD